MIEATCHHPDHRSCWQQTFQVLPREGETLIRLRTETHQDELEVDYPVFVVEQVEHHCESRDPRIPATVHLFLEIFDNGEDDDEELALLPEFPPPGRAEPNPLLEQLVARDEGRLQDYLAALPAFPVPA